MQISVPFWIKDTKTSKHKNTHTQLTLLLAAVCSNFHIPHNQILDKTLHKTEIKGMLENCKSCNKTVLHPILILHQDISNYYSGGWKTHVVFVALRFGLWRCRTLLVWHGWSGKHPRGPCCGGSGSGSCTSSVRCRGWATPARRSTSWSTTSP